MPTEDDFPRMFHAYREVAPDPGHFEAFMAKMSATVRAFPGWSDDDLRGLPAEALLIASDTDFMPVEHTARMHTLIPEARRAVLPDTTHSRVMACTDLLLPMLDAFLSSDPAALRPDRRRSGVGRGIAPGAAPAQGHQVVAVPGQGLLVGALDDEPGVGDHRAVFTPGPTFRGEVVAEEQ